MEKSDHGRSVSQEFKTRPDEQHSAENACERDMMFSVCFRHRQQLVEGDVDHDASDSREKHGKQRLCQERHQEEESDQCPGGFGESG